MGKKREKKLKLIIIVPIIILTLGFFIFLSTAAKENQVQGNNSPTLTPSTTQVSYIRLAGPDRYVTAVEVSKYGWPNGSETIILARGDDFPDALAGASLAGKWKAPIILTWPSELPESIKLEITRLKSKRVFILGSENAISDNIRQQLILLGINTSGIERLGGADRYITNSQIISKLEYAINNRNFIVTGDNFPDALSISSWAAYNGGPIALARKYSTDYTIVMLCAWLTSSGGYIIGGQDVLTDSAAFGTIISRLYGDDRYGTSKVIAENSPLSKEGIIITNGENFPDGLVAGPFHKTKKDSSGKSYNIYYRILLVRKDFIPEPIKEYLEKNKDWIKEVYILGESDVVSNKVVDEIKSILGS